MLVLSRRIGDKIVIGDNIVVTVVDVHRDSVRIGIDAPSSVPINRSELLEAVGQENKAATMSESDAAATLASLRGIRPKRDLSAFARISASAHKAQKTGKESENNASKNSNDMAGKDADPDAGKEKHD